jgi:hypothetical protein
MSKRRTLTDALTQALASVDPTDPVVPDAAAKPAEEAPPAEPTPSAVPVVAAETAANALTDYLKSEIVTLKASLTEAQTANAALQAQVTAFAGDNVPAMKATLGSVIKLIAVPLNATVIGLDGFNGAQLVSTYNELQTQLNANFKPGAKSSAASDEPTTAPVKPTAANVNPITPAARVRTPPKE